MRKAALVMILPVLLGGGFIGRKLYRKWEQRRAYAALIAPIAEASWPWPGARQEKLAQGVEHWQAVSPDGTALDLLSFDFAANPRLNFELDDSDLALSPNKEKPENRFPYWVNGVGKAAARLNQEGNLVAAWTGGFWGMLGGKSRIADRAFHVSPIVQNGKVYYRGINRRWSWGAKLRNGKPEFALLHAPKPDGMERAFDHATGTLQALLKDGKPLQVAPYPWFGAKPKKLGLPSTSEQSGPISILDHMHTSRVGAGWTDSGRLFVVVVKEPDGETPSRAAVNARKRGQGGWTLLDHQNFWLAMQKAFGVKHAVGLDGGDVAQAIYRRPDRKYEVLVPRIATPEHEEATRRIVVQPDFAAPELQELKGGALNYFVIRENRN